MSEQQQEYGGIIINGIDCSGGSRSSVTPNPPAPATETLSSLDINGVVYGIEQETRENIFNIFDTINVNSNCSSGTLTLDAYVFGIDDARNDWSGSTTIYNNNAYDLTNIDKLELVVTVTEQSDYAYLWLTFSDTKYTWGTSSWPGVYQNKISTLQISQSGSYEVDVSELTGSYYIYVGATSGKDDTTPGDCNNTHDGVITGTVTEFNIISSSMGTSVTPNPSGNATEVLKKIKIDEDIYKVADIEEVTEEQYTVLPSTKNSDDTVYMVKHIEDIFDGGSTISLLGGNGITLESSSVTEKIGTLSAYEYSAGYEGFNIALQNLTVGQIYKLEFDFQFTNAQFIGNDYRCAYLISATQNTNYTDYTQWTENLPRDLVKYHHSVQFTASATTMYVAFNLCGCSDSVNNYFTMNNIYVINTIAQNKIMLNGNQYGTGSNGTEVIANPSDSATDTLNTIKIGDTVYGIEGNGGGGSSAFIDTSNKLQTIQVASGDNWSYIATQDCWATINPWNSSNSTPSQIYLDNVELVAVYNSKPQYAIYIKQGQTLLIKARTDYTYGGIYGLLQSNSGKGYTRDTLYNSQITTPQQVTLSDNIDNYDVLEVVVAGGTSLTSYQIDVNYFKEACPYVANPTYENDHWIIHTYQNRYIRIIMGDANNKIYPYDINNQTIEEINGIKYNTSDGGGNVDDVYVNGESVLDANKIAQIKTHKEVSLAEYEDANDDIIYFVDGDDDELGIYYSPVIYSTQEREIGAWTDGKPLYQKSFMQQISGNSVHIDVSNLNIENGWLQSGYYDIGVTNLGLNEYLSSSMYTYTHLNNELNPPYIDCYIYGANNSTVYVTIQYTKTTDTPGSAKYNALGVPMVHYSTDEQVIGTWIDGKPIYRKIYDWTASPFLVSTSWQNTNIDSTNIDRIISAIGMHQDGTLYNDTCADPTKSNHTRVGIKAWADGYYAYLILEYTKTTD